MFSYRVKADRTVLSDFSPRGSLLGFPSDAGVCGLSPWATLDPEARTWLMSPGPAGWGSGTLMHTPLLPRRAEGVRPSFLHSWLACAHLLGAEWTLPTPPSSLHLLEDGR